jgi:hypothetical protein
MAKKTPIDLKIVSIFFFLSAFSYFSVNTNVNFVFGIAISGLLAKALWVISCLICIIGAYGLWSKNLLIWKIILVYTYFYLINSTLNFFFITPSDRIRTIPPDEIPKNFEPSDGSIFFLIAIFIHIGLIFYLYKRKPLFK